MKINYSRIFITLLLISTMLFTTSSVAFAEANTNPIAINSDFLAIEGTIVDIAEPTGWSKWTVRGVNYSSSLITSFVDSILWDIVISGLTGGVSGVATIVNAIKSLGKLNERVYYKTTTYQRTDGTGRIQMYSVRVFFKYKYYQSIGSVTTSIVTYNSTVKSMPDPSLLY